jgi:flagellar motor switch protein FliM
MLSQSEIDALLSGAIEIEEPNSQNRVNLAELMGQGPALTPAKADNRQVQAYNFWSPDRFSKEQMRAVEVLHEDLAERLTTTLPTFLRTNLRPRVVHTEQGRFHDFMRDLKEGTIYHLITLNPLPGQMVLTISPDISYVILEQRLGGQAESSSTQRPLTEIDQALLRGMVENMLNDIKAAWARVAAVEPGLDDSTINSHWVQMMMGNDRMLLITFELSIQGVAGTMNCYIPFTLLKPIAASLNPHVWISGYKDRPPDPGARQMALEGLSPVTLPVRVFLGNAKLTLDEIINLQAGDVLRLDTPLNQDLPVQVAGQTCFLGRVGRRGTRLAAQITTIVNPALDLKQSIRI